MTSLQRMSSIKFQCGAEVSLQFTPHYDHTKHRREQIGRQKYSRSRGRCFTVYTMSKTWHELYMYIITYQSRDKLALQFNSPEKMLNNLPGGLTNNLQLTPSQLI